MIEEEIDRDIEEIREAIRIVKSFCCFAAIVLVGMAWGVVAALRWAFA